MAIGTRGGLGGLGSSFPMRASTAPTSQQVDYLPSYADWDADWNRRRNEIRGETLQMVPGAEGYNSYDSAQYKQLLFDRMVYDDLLKAGAKEKDLHRDTLEQYQKAVGGADAYFAFKNAPYGAGYTEGGYQFSPGAAGLSEAQRNYYDPFGGKVGLNSPFPDRSFWQGSHTVDTGPDYRALDAEREAMMPKFAPQFLQQSAYDAMAGSGQRNAVLGANYTAPTFGQINGDPGIGQGGNPAAGVGASANGVFNPSDQSVGVFGGQRRGTGWGLF